MSFKYENKETFTNEEVKILLEQHQGYLTKNVFNPQIEELKTNSETTIKELNDKLQPYVEKEKQARVFDLTKNLTSKEKLDAALKLTSINDDYSDEDIIKSVKETIKKYTFLQTQVEGESITSNVDNKKSEKKYVSKFNTDSNTVKYINK